MSFTTVYMDESGSHADSPVLCVAGYIFERDNAARFTTEWQSLLSEYGLPYFRMSACAHGTDPFSALSKEQRIAVQTAAIPLIKKYTECGFATSLNEVEYSEIIQPLSPGKFSAYSFCLQNCMRMVKLWARGRGNFGPFAYFFETGHRDQKATNEWMSEVYRDEHKKRQRMYHSHTFTDKRECPPLQAADVLAWQTFTFTKNWRAGSKRMRADFRALLRVQDFEDKYDRTRLLELRDYLVKRYMADRLNGNP